MILRLIPYSIAAAIAAVLGLGLTALGFGPEVYVPGQVVVILFWMEWVD